MILKVEYSTEPHRSLEVIAREQWVDPDWGAEAWGQSQIPSRPQWRRPKLGLGEERRLSRAKADEGHKKEEAWIQLRHRA